MKKPANSLNYKKMLPRTALREDYESLPSFMVRQNTKNGVKMISEKALADVESEKWKFYEAPTTFKLYSNSQLSILKTKLKTIMREKSYNES